MPSRLGDLRFRATVAKKPWQGILDAGRFGAAGPQMFDPTEGSYREFTGADKPESGRTDWVGSEDNLTLNVWTPEIRGQKRPVLVWIHGGANWLESSRLAAYDGDRLAARGDVVFVSINYRLGIFGWLDVSGLGGESYSGSHSNGLRDQITALRWIRQNIAAFGGDPENITVMGESAGSIDLSWLLANGLLEGIARRVILMSGIAGLVGLSGDLRTGFTEEYGRTQAKDFLARLKIGSMPELLALSTEQIMGRVVDVAKTVDMLFVMDSLFWPRVSPDFAPVDPLRAAGKGASGIDVMVGHTTYEMGLWLTWDESLDRHPCSWAAGKILDFDPPVRAEAGKLYDDCFAGDEPGARGLHLIGDSIFVMPTLWFADRLARQGAKIWMYQFAWETDKRRRALHAADQTYLFDKHDTDAGRHLLGVAKDKADRMARAELTAAMQDAVLAFARSGNPDAHENDGLPRWPLYSEKDRAAMNFDFECRIVKDPARERRIWWYERVYAPALGD